LPGSVIGLRIIPIGFKTISSLASSFGFSISVYSLFRIASTANRKSAGKWVVWPVKRRQIMFNWICVHSSNSELFVSWFADVSAGL
jgi:hypothetical protein